MMKEVLWPKLFVIFKILRFNIFSNRYHLMFFAHLTVSALTYCSCEAFTSVKTFQTYGIRTSFVRPLRNQPHQSVCRLKNSYFRTWNFPYFLNPYFGKKWHQIFSLFARNRCLSGYLQATLSLRLVVLQIGLFHHSSFVPSESSSS